ncbi:MAG: molecular chaperone TorD family protein [Chloroflexi bacterium]|nr:molecular chaperone TorD family protein [Chloroflexota bacterium]
MPVLPPKPAVPAAASPRSDRLWSLRVARFRQGAYRLLALMFRTPGDDHALIPAAASTVRAFGAQVPDLACVQSLDAWLASLESLDARRLVRLAHTYSTLFRSTGTSGFVPLCETEYIAQGGDLIGTMPMLESAYRGVGFRLLAGSREPADHISVELEYAGLLCAREEMAWAARDGHAAARLMWREQHFLSRHLHLWVPALARAIERQHAGVYASTARAAWALIAHDTDFLRAWRKFTRREIGPGAPNGAR